MMFRRAQFPLGIGIDAGVSASQIPDARLFQFGVRSFCIGDEYFRALVGKLIIEFAPQHDADVFRDRVAA